MEKKIKKECNEGVVMKGISLRLVLVLLISGILGWTISSFAEDDQQRVQDLYKKIGDDLITIRKEFSGAQPKVFSVLDQIDKMYSITKSTMQKNQDLSKDLKRHAAENLWLKNEVVNVRKELSSAKQTIEATQNSLEDVHTKLEDEKKEARLLAQEKNTLEDKVQNLEMQKPEKKKTLDIVDVGDGERDKNHEVLAHVGKQRGRESYNFNRTSTSEPSSPR